MVSLTVSHKRGHGLRYLDPARDLPEVVRLLNEVFAEEMDAAGRRALREMRWLARLTPLLGSWVFGPGIYGRALVAFVWEEDGRIVGHASVQRLDRWGRRWLVANVAVAEPYRNRGIGRRLMEAVLDHVRTQGGTWAVLQVRADNPAALHLYRTLGFEPIGGEIRWSGLLTSSVPRTDREVRLRRLSWREMGEVRALFSRAQSEEARWWTEGLSDPAAFPMDWEGLGTWLLRWVGAAIRAWYGLRMGSRLLAALYLEGRPWQRRGRFGIWVDRHVWGRWEEDLVAFALERLYAAGIRYCHIRTDAVHTALSEALRAAGLTPRLHLVNMRCWVQR